METLCLSEFRGNANRAGYLLMGVYKKERVSLKCTNVVGAWVSTSVRANAHEEIMHRQTAGECVVHNLVDRFLIHNLLPIEVCLRHFKHHPFRTGELKGRA